VLVRKDRPIRRRRRKGFVELCGSSGRLTDRWVDGRESGDRESDNTCKDMKVVWSVARKPSQAACRPNCLYHTLRLLSFYINCIKADLNVKL